MEFDTLIETQTPQYYIWLGFEAYEINTVSLNCYLGDVYLKGDRLNENY